MQGVLLVGALIAVNGCSGGEKAASPFSTTQKLPASSSQGSPTAEESLSSRSESVLAAEVALMRRDFGEYVDAYNAGNFSKASQLADPGMIADACGSKEAYIAALDQNFAVERLEYELVKVDPETAVRTGDTVTIDLYFDSFDPVSGEQVDFALGVGLTFRSEVPGRWLLADAFPLGAPSFC